METENQFQLLSQRRFLPFFLTQVCGALNDNVFKNALLIMIAFRGVEELGISSGIVVNVASILFILPFFLFSATFGQFADKFEFTITYLIFELLERGWIFAEPIFIRKEITSIFVVVMSLDRIEYVKGEQLV